MNATGQLGNGTNTDSNLPVQVTGLTDAVILAGGGSHSLGVGSASAATALVLQPNSGPPGTLVQVTGSGFVPNEIVWVGFDRTKVGSIRADASGGFSRAFRIPRSAYLGTHTIHGTGKTSGLYAESSFVVT